MRRRTPLVLAAALAAALPLVISGSASAAPAEPVVVASGLDNPRQLSWGSNGGLLVAEAGRGKVNPGPNACFTGPEGENCLGVTGGISRIANPARTVDGDAKRVVTGLLSGASREGGSAVGSNGVSFQKGKILVAMTWVPPDVLPRTGVPKWQVGQLIQATPWPSHAKKAIADLAAIELEQNPDGTDVNPNPYAVLALDDHRSVVADAGGNHLVLVDRGKAKVLTVMPAHGCGGVVTPECDMHSVPTSLTKGPGNALYVGELAHFEPGEARIVKVSPKTGRILGFYGRGGTICARDTAGFSGITGVAFGPDGSLYVSELFGGATGGQVVRISPSCKRTAVPVPMPAGLLTDGKGNVFVSAFSISDRDGADGAPPGQVWKLRF